MGRPAYTCSTILGILIYKNLRHRRLIFNATLDTFPGAFLTLTAGLMLASAFAYFYLFTQRKTIARAVQDEEQERGKGDDTEF